MHIRQKCHELAVMAFLEGFGISAEFIIHFLPDPTKILLQILPMTMDLRKFREWQQLEGPDQNLVKRAHQRYGAFPLRLQAHSRGRLTSRFRRHRPPRTASWATPLEAAPAAILATATMSRKVLAAYATKEFDKLRQGQRSPSPGRRARCCCQRSGSRPRGGRRLTCHPSHHEARHRG